eukprot:COSAG02_NODE_62117_length_266_cov_2.251497_1_plen_39_part_01
MPMQRKFVTFRAVVASGPAVVGTWVHPSCAGGGGGGGGG